MPFPPEVMAMLFTENAANSSLRVYSLAVLELAAMPACCLSAAIQSQWLPTPAATPA
jgi:hypothetical protein